MSDVMPDVPALAHGVPVARAVLRARPEDFVVEEILGYEPGPDAGADSPAPYGEHVWLQLRKRGLNTDWLARRLAQFAGVRAGDVGYAGLKDRLAVTTQWFSVHLPGRAEPDWAAFIQLFEPGELVLVSRVRHSRKLKRGGLRGNRFVLRLSALRGDVDALEARLSRLREAGVPNYFGPQRFGHGGQNLVQARAMLLEGRRVRDRHKRGLYLSAARSWLFNRVLSARVAQGCWDTALPGDVLMLAGSHSHFCVETLDETVLARVASQDVHPSGPLWGKGERAVQDAAARVEDAALAGLEDWGRALAGAGLKQERRALRLGLADLSWTLTPPAGAEPGALILRFSLPAGSYATAVVRELMGDVNANTGTDAPAHDAAQRPC